MSRRRLHCARGVVLPLALLFVLLISLTAGSMMHTGIVEYRLTGNHQLRQRALQTARSVASAIAARPDNFPLGGAVGQLICAPDAVAPQCDPGAVVTLPNQLRDSHNRDDWHYQVERQGPLWRASSPTRAPERQVSSALAYHLALFEVAVQVADGAGGTADIVHGVALRAARRDGGRWE